MTTNTITRGSLFMANLTANGHVQGGIRPVLIVQNDVGNKHSPTVQVIPLTSQQKNPMPTHTIIKGFGLSKPSTALAEQMQTINKSQLIRAIGAVDQRTMDCVCVLHYDTAWTEKYIGG